MNKGTIASSGLAMGRAFILESPTIDIKQETCDDAQTELNKYQEAVEKSTNDLTKLRDKAQKDMGSDHAEIFDAHIQMVQDPEMKGQVEAMIEGENHCADAAFKKVSDQFIEIFSAMEDEYFKARAADIKDIQSRMITYLQGETPKDMGLLEEDTIVFAHDLTPSDTASLDLDKVKGFVTEVGGYTSHTAIMARALNIPALVGVSNALQDVSDGDDILLDADNNAVKINPDDDARKEANARIKAQHERLERLKQYKNQPTKTSDGQAVPLFANMGSVKELKGITDTGAEGVGLFRTEFLFMESDAMPTEDEQIKAYKQVFDTINPVIVRTLDVGGDKNIPYIDQAKEDNPFLGKRAVRLYFDEIDIFKTQIRALLRAAKDSSDVRIMIPMIARADEIDWVYEQIDAVKKTLDDENIAYQNNIKVGIMIEIPSAALNAKALAKKVDFFSIGSNDLIQYTYATDRMNESVGYLYEPYDPTLLRLMKTALDGAHDASIHIGVCGEMAGNFDLALVLAGMGMDELSMSPSSILPIREALSQVPFKKLKELSDHVCGLDDAEAVKKTIQKFKDDEL